ncbi:OmpA family protein [Shewanella fidelis]|uniref:OmpA family protein n=1 Tax=Shewanella fidelis TaxID=173509 RepID=UPI0004BA6A9D|nr:OmpA family protein [Shewanella fidelis]
MKMMLVVIGLMISPLCASEAQIKPWPDADLDGVPDLKDACANTVNNKTVDASGCSENQRILAQKHSLSVMPLLCFNSNTGGLFPRSCSEISTIAVRFEFAKAQVLISQQPSLQTLSRWLKANNVPLVVVGHTDSVGEATFNQQLSVERAQEVKRVLVQQFGLAANRLQIKGMGSTDPVASNQTAHGREINRRVEFLVNVQ